MANRASAIQLLFFKPNGDPEMARQYTGPGSFYMGQNELVTYDFPDHKEGDQVEFHVGHGAFYTYEVVAIDQEMALLRDVGYEKHRFN